MSRLLVIGTDGEFQAIDNKRADELTREELCLLVAELAQQVQTLALIAGVAEIDSQSIN